MKKTTLKTLIGLFTLTTLALTSCSEKKPNRDEIVRKNAEEYLKEKMNDPKSYEFVKLELIDSVLYSDNIKYRKENFNKNIEDNKDEIKRKEEYKIEIPSMYDEREIEELKADIAKNEKIIAKIDSLETKLGTKKNQVASYTYVFSFRGNNALGAKILNEYILQTNPSPDFKIINMTDDKDKVFLNPNDFPGYREMIAKNL
ncbi:hypothetical protein HNP99_001038 [Flavobacterium sp. 28A]|uniref:hypothetical protein n=1 Tax=Flavobacterium sp. 28A TaxID=2735895 RepID=UPI00156DD980|nr:hypothetical protein [Flavobacterium sp. 28A]NRT14694.1 hypothetical protein [Flavobacterium sp. 28A]